MVRAFALALLLAVNPHDLLALTYTPPSLAFSVTEGGQAPPAQTIAIDKKSLVARQWTATPTASWLTVTPSAGTIFGETNTITVQIKAEGMTAGSYSGAIQIALSGSTRQTQTATIPVTVIVTNGTDASESIALHTVMPGVSRVAAGASKP
jgi:hypothetical protein